MQIVLKRIAKKKTYTIGRLYILKDEDVKKRTIESVNKCRGLKTVCEVPQEKLNADSYFCDTMEPCWRNLLGVELSPAEENVRLGRVSGKKAQKMKGKTAIPEGTYPVVISKSPSFKMWLPLLLGVPNFEAIAKPEWVRGDHMTPLKKALEHEKLVTASIDAIYAAAYEARDFRAMQMLDWFIKEQGEEEKNAADLITKMELFGGDSKGLYMLNSELKARAYTAPSLVL